jgi:3-phenylpropionate/cinnamic acid dioxygenase small subunit
MIRVSGGVYKKGELPSMAIKSAPGAFADADLSLDVGAGVYHDIQHFLFREALLLDHHRFDEWLGLLADDVVFRMPSGFARGIGMETPAGVEHFNDDRRALTARIRTLQERIVSGQIHPGQTRRFITNVIICPCSRDEYNVMSYLMLTRNARGEAHSQVYSAERYDRLRRAGHKLRIVRREIVLDQRDGNVDIDMYL